MGDIIESKVACETSSGWETTEVGRRSTMRLRTHSHSELRPQDFFGSLPTDPPQPTPAYAYVFFHCQDRSVLRPVQTIRFRRTASPTPHRHSLSSYGRRPSLIRRGCEEHSGAMIMKPGAFTDMKSSRRRKSRDCRRSCY